MAPNSKTETQTQEKAPGDFHFLLTCLKNLDTDKAVDLEKVREALGYTNAASVGNRFRAIRKAYDLVNFESKNGRGRSKPGTKLAKAPRKRAKVSSSKPIPATGPVCSTESGDDEYESALGLPDNTPSVVVEGKSEGQLDPNLLVAANMVLGEGRCDVWMGGNNRGCSEQESWPEKEMSNRLNPNEAGHGMDTSSVPWGKWDRDW